jgi:hypothetical protein
LVVVLLMRRLLMRVFSASVVVPPMGQSWAVEGAQEQVDRDTPVSKTPTGKVYNLCIV